MPDRKPLAVGERVAVYSVRRITGFVKSIISEDCIEVEHDEEFCDRFVAGAYHPKQLRRIVKRPRREFWVVCEPDGKPLAVRSTQEQAEVTKGSYGSVQIIHVREVVAGKAR